jgi:WS/DGAT/MGAT family acyltransferase
VRGYAYERLSVVDGSFLAIESPNTHQHVAAVTVFEAGPLARADGGLDFDRIRAYVAARLHLIPRYRQRIVAVPLGTRRVWADDEHFNLDYHLRHTSLPRPGSAEQLRRLAARIVSQPLDRARPLWEIWVVEGLAGGGRFALIAKTHHCMIDGVSGVDLMAVLLSPAADDVPGEAPRWLPRPAPTPFQLFRDEMLRRARETAALVRGVPWTPAQVRGALDAVWQSVGALGETLLAAASPASETPLNRPIGPHRRFDWLVLDLADVKAVKDRLGGTVNDVVLATVAGALQRFLERRRVNVDVLDVRASVPVSLRGADGRGTLGNQIAVWVTPLPVAERDPLRRLARVRDATARLKASRQTLGAQVLAAVSEWTSSTLLSLAVQLSVRSRPFNLVVTNVPGPQLPLYLLGAPLVECYPMLALLPNQGLGIALFSYAGKLCWGFLADFDLVPDLHDAVRAVAASFDELRAAAGIAPVTGAEADSRSR